MAQTFVDCLTRIFNRSKCCSDLDSAMRHASEVAYILADLDQFKKVNDTYGHGVGDAVRGGGKGPCVRTSTRFLCPTHLVPSSWLTTPLRSSIMDASLMRIGSGSTRRSYRATWVAMFRASSSSHRAVISFASTFSRVSCRNIRLFIRGKRMQGCTPKRSRDRRCRSVIPITKGAGV